MPEQKLNGCTIAYQEKGKGLPVVLAHGFPLDGRIWHNQVDELSQVCRVIVPDLPGFGKSTCDGPFSIESLADALHEFLEKIDALPCVLVGLSMAGYVALAHIRKYPTDLKGLVLVDTRCEADSPEGKAGRMKMIESCRQQGAKAVAEAMMPKMLAADCAKQEVKDELQRIMEDCRPQTIEYALLAMRDREDYRAELASIAIPTLIIVGLCDTLTTPEMAQGMHHEIAHSELEIIPDAGHMTPLEQPEKFNEVLREFLEKI